MVRKLKQTLNLLYLTYFNYFKKQTRDGNAKRP